LATAGITYGAGRTIPYWTVKGYRAVRGTPYVYKRVTPTKFSMKITGEQVDYGWYVKETTRRLKHAPKQPSGKIVATYDYTAGMAAQAKGAVAAAGVKGTGILTYDFVKQVGKLKVVKQQVKPIPAGTKFFPPKETVVRITKVKPTTYQLIQPAKGALVEVFYKRGRVTPLPYKALDVARKAHIRTTRQTFYLQTHVVKLPKGAPTGQTAVLTGRLTWKKPPKPPVKAPVIDINKLIKDVGLPITRPVSRAVTAQIAKAATKQKSVLVSVKPKPLPKGVSIPPVVAVQRRQQDRTTRTVIKSMVDTAQRTTPRAVLRSATAQAQRPKTRAYIKPIHKQLPKMKPLLVSAQAQKIRQRIKPKLVSIQKQDTAQHMKPWLASITAQVVKPGRTPPIMPVVQKPKTFKLPKFDREPVRRKKKEELLFAKHVRMPRFAYAPSLTGLIGGAPSLARIPRFTGLEIRGIR
jgi:hypothetical protein